VNHCTGFFSTASWLHLTNNGSVKQPLTETERKIYFLTLPHCSTQNLTSCS